MEVIISENYEIYKLENSIYKIKFRYNAYALVSSLVNSRLIIGSSTDESYKTITFKAESVKTLKQYLYDYNLKTGNKNILVVDLVKMITSLVMQLSYLLEKTYSTIIGYNPEEIIVINEKKFVFLGSELIAKLDKDTEEVVISYPFNTMDFFVSPELLKIKEIPIYVNYKISYFSLACLLLFVISGDDEFYKEYLIHKEPLKILEILNNHPIKNTRIYWLLSRCLVEDAKNRSIIYL